eukprot:10383085-Alexandrium_andersonii.AAC.1
MLQRLVAASTALGNAAVSMATYTVLRRPASVFSLAAERRSMPIRINKRPWCRVDMTLRAA